MKASGKAIFPSATKRGHGNLAPALCQELMKNKLLFGTEKIGGRCYGCSTFVVPDIILVASANLEIARLRGANMQGLASDSS